MTIAATLPETPHAPRRMEALATLPVFFRMAGRKAIVAGGSEAAAWKAELLAATGAEVHVYAEDIDPAFEAVIAAGSLVHHARRWDQAILPGAAVAICDAATEAEAKAFADAARAAGVPVNVIDKPADCDFQFGSIVNRSPVVVAVSTDGAAPILGQAIRRRVETLLPPALAGWAGLARAMRYRIAATLAAGPQRRAFWEHFVDRAFGSTPGEGAFDNLMIDASDIASGAHASQGRVTLVGAGPGDAELLTLKAVRTLQSADVILFDDLVSDDVLELARREAKRMLVGKRGGRESCRQEDINATMIALAKAGKHVVRLKGGDPMIFGRAGEEIDRLRANGIPVSVVPGITSALAMASSLGVSLTHRDCAQSVRFVTGHSRKGELPKDVDWRAIADPTATTIFYMGGRTAGEIASCLMANGAASATPVVVARAISRPAEKRWAGRLADLAEGMRTIGYDEPVLIGVGKVFNSVVLESAGNRPVAAERLSVPA